MSHSDSIHHDDEQKVLSFTDRRDSITLPEDLGVDPLQELLDECKQFEEEIHEEKKGICSLSLIESKLENLELLTLEEKAKLLKEIIQRSHFYMHDLEFYLDKSS